MKIARAVLVTTLIAPGCSADQRTDGTMITPDSALNELLAADRAFGAAAPDTDIITALSAMFAPDVILPVPGGVFVEGLAQAADAIRSNPANADTRVSWTPARAGISADAQHGFTLGYMTAVRADSSRSFLKYLAYWVKRPEGWRVQAYKRSPTDSARNSMMTAALPTQLAAPETDSAVISRYRESLADAERSFSRDAQSIGIGAAFLQYGSDDAVNMGPPAGPFVVGKAAIAVSVAGNQSANTSPVSWEPDYRVIVASSGDLGVTFGFIRRNPPADSTAPPFAFFTIWRRLRTSDPWRYIAE